MGFRFTCPYVSTNFNLLFSQTHNLRVTPLLFIIIISPFQSSCIILPCVPANRFNLCIAGVRRNWLQVQRPPCPVQTWRHAGQGPSLSTQIDFATKSRDCAQEQRIVLSMGDKNVWGIRNRFFLLTNHDSHWNGGGGWILGLGEDDLIDLSARSTTAATP